jgi:16S rRNA (uracil1498-N3)-methyltransferase
MADRYFSETPISVGSVTLDGPEAHHLIHVMRAARGTRVVLFDGSGAEFPAMVERVDRSTILLNALSREVIDRELSFDLILGVALPKGDRQKWLVEKAVELGVTKVIPLRTERGVAQPVEQALTRLRRSVVEASKQCGRNCLMEITEPAPLDDFLESAAGGTCRLLAHPKGFHTNPDLQKLLSCLNEAAQPSEASSSNTSPLPSTGSNPPASAGTESCEGKKESQPSPSESTEHAKPVRKQVWLAIGPEGGFSPVEVPMAIAAGWHTIDLGARILRVETAALALAALITQLVSLGPCVRE